jgi:acyl-CoA thioesterase-1
MLKFRTLLFSLFLLGCIADNQDWAQLIVYNVSDAILSKFPAGTNEVIFLGDSITDSWNLTNWFPGRQYINRGISGQTTPQMLVRLREDVIDLKPKAIHILAGTNDLAGNTGFEPLEIMQKNFESITELAQIHNIKVIIASVTPVCGNMVVSRPPEKILALNKWIKEYCASKSLIYLDYFSHMIGPDGLLIPSIASDCLHPLANGYDIMAPLAQAAINEALTTSTISDKEIYSQDIINKVKNYLRSQH